MLDWIKINLPILGPMFRKVTISRSIRTLGTMLASGVPVMEAIRLAGEVSGNFYYERLWTKVLDEVTGGKRICEVLARQPPVPQRAGADDRRRRRDRQARRTCWRRSAPTTTARSKPR